jgi:hypothetical protein
MINFNALYLQKKVMNKQKQSNIVKRQKRDSEIKRNNQAPDFPSTLILSRSQLIIERYMQVYAPNLEEYIQNGQILKLHIDISTLRSWYPTKHWKKDIETTCLYMMNVRNGTYTKKGDFELYSLLTYARLDETGLHVNVDPEVMKKYIIESSTTSTSIDVDITNRFKKAYTHQFYWLMCKNDRPTFDYKFYLTPEEINTLFSTNYQSSNIKVQILMPVQEEIKKLYEERIIPNFFTFNERRELKGKTYQIIGWEFIIYNETRTQRTVLEAKDAIVKIDRILFDFSFKYRITSVEQARTLSFEQIIKLSQRLDKFKTDGRTDIYSLTGYLCHILQRYGIDPRKKAKIGKLLSAPLFNAEENEIDAGLNYWNTCLDHIKNSEIDPKIIDIFANHLKFKSYEERQNASHITFITDTTTMQTIETYFIKDLAKVLTKYFPYRVHLYYNVPDKNKLSN